MDIGSIQKNISKAGDIIDTVDDLVNGKDKAPKSKIETIIDKDWISGMFLIRGEDLEEKDRYYRYYSSAHMKFTDTSMGGNIGVNCRPQFTRYCDIRVPGRLVNRNKVTVNSKTGNYGMGIYYSEAIDDNAQTVFMEFGVPEFNSLFTYFTRAIDYKTSVIANTGRSPVLYNIGTGIGAVAMFIAFPVASIAIYAAKYLSNALLGTGSFDYYYMKPTMHMYWSTVNSLTTMMAIELGILSSVVMDTGKTDRNKLGIPLKIKQEDMDVLREAAPDIFTEANYIDVFAIANKAQIIANKQHENLQKLKDKGEGQLVDDFASYIMTKYEKEIFRNDDGVGFEGWVKDILKLDKLFGKTKENKEEPNSVTNEDKKDKINDDGTITVNDKDKLSWADQYKKYFEATVKGGGQYATFKVDYLGTINESFSNTIKDIPTEGMIKTVTGKGRDVRFMLNSGNLVDGLGTIINGVTDVVAGTIDSATFGLSNVLNTMLGGAYMDIPKMWDDSEFTAPKLSFSMQLISPYAHPIAQLQNIYIPLAMLLAGGLPLQAGRASYTSPFLCSTYIKGMQRIKMGIITDISITRGTSNLAFNKQKKALALDVTFSVTDLSNIMTAPINTDFTNVFSAVFDNDNSISNYIATLGARDFKTTIYNSQKAKIRFSRKHLGYEKVTSPSYWANVDGDLVNGMIGGLLADYNTTLNFEN